MTSRTAATRYARALFDVSVKEGVDLEDAAAQLGGFADLLRQHDMLGKLLVNPAVPAPRKRATVSELLAHLSMPTVVSKLLLLLAERDRLVILSDIVDAYRQRLLDHANIVRAEVTTATPLPADKAQNIEARLAQATGRGIRLSTRVDPSIVGGIIARVGGTVYDGSISGQLERMKKKLELV
jgi:F-type H+-transporting ATPase subunit delta